MTVLGLPFLHLSLPLSPSAALWPIAKGALVAVTSFAVLGTVSALWSNPFFVRMVPAGEWEIAMLLLLSLFAGLFTAVRRPYCSLRSAGFGGIVGFLGIACPICNKLLMLIFGGELLLAYFEPLRIYVAAAGTLVLALAAGREMMLRRQDRP